MPVPTELHVTLNGSLGGSPLVMSVRLDTARGASIPDLCVTGYRDGKRTPVATARLDSGCGVWDITLPSGEERRMAYPVLAVEGPSNDRDYWRAVRRVADLFAVDVVRDTMGTAGILL